MELLLTKGADPNKKDNSGFSVLVNALDELSDEEGLLIARTLVRFGAHVENIVIAAHLGSLSLVESFIKREPSLVNFQNLSEETALHYAVWYKYRDIIELLVHNGADVNIQNYRKQTALHCAAEIGDLGTAKILLDNGAHIELKDKNGKTALELAIVNGKDEMAELLHSYGTKV